MARPKPSHAAGVAGGDAELLAGGKVSVRPSFRWMAATCSALVRTSIGPSSSSSSSSSPPAAAASQPQAAPEVLGRVQQLLDEGRIDKGEARALLREVARPERERADSLDERDIVIGKERIKL